MKTRTTLQVLKAARRRILNPLRWTQGAVGRDALGRRCETTAEVRAGVCWCLAGAVDIECNDIPHLYDVVMKALDDASPFGCGAICVNDYLGHAATVALASRAIARCGAGRAALEAGPTCPGAALKAGGGK